VYSTENIGTAIANIQKIVRKPTLRTRTVDHRHQSSPLTNYITRAVRQAGGMRLAHYVEEGGGEQPASYVFSQTAGQH
jgi:hypothetical protein